MQRQTSHMSGILESDNLFNKSSPLYDNTLADSFLYSSPTSVPSSQSSLLNGPPLPPRNYMQSDYLSPTQQTPPPLPSRSILPTERRPFFNSIDSNLVNLHTSTHSSTSLSSPHHGYSGYWNRWTTIEEGDFEAYHGAAIEFGFGLHLTKRLSAGYAFDWDSKSKYKGHYFRFGLMF